MTGDSSRNAPGPHGFGSSGNVPGISLGPHGVQITGLSAMPQPPSAAPSLPALRGHVRPSTMLESAEQLDAIVRRYPTALPALLGSGGLAMMIAAGFLVLGLGFPAFWGLFPGLSALVLLVSAGVLRSRALAQHRSGQLPSHLEAQMLAVAERAGGRLTALDAAREMQIAIDDADAALVSLAKRGHIQQELDETTGVLVYAFPSASTRRLAEAMSPGPNAGPSGAKLP